MIERSGNRAVSCLCLFIYYKIFFSLIMCTAFGLLLSSDICSVSVAAGHLTVVVQRILGDVVLQCR